MKKCSVCAELKDETCFSPTKRNEDGSVKYRHSQCNACRTTSNRIREGWNKRVKSEVDLESQTKQCADCKIKFEFSMFSKSTRGSAGLSAYCKACHKKRYSDKEKSRLYTATYRANNLEWWRSLHRLHQHNRKSLIKASEDGTVTKEFTKSVYAQEVCYWCECYIEEGDRTLEHIIELSNGGLHSADNITMACFSCNSSRFNKGVTKIESD